MTEIWKPIAGYEGYYEVSNLGNVRSLDRYVKGKANNLSFRKGRAIKKEIGQRGYYSVCLAKNAERKFEMVHTLVAKAFIPNPENKNVVNHKDFVKTNNSVDNLEWVTTRENNIHAIRNGRRKISAKVIESACKSLIIAHEKSKIPIAMIGKQGDVIKTFASITDAGKYLRHDCSHISEVLKGTRKSAYGYKWERVEKGEKSNVSK